MEIIALRDEQTPNRDAGTFSYHTNRRTRWRMIKSSPALYLRKVQQIIITMSYNCYVNILLWSSHASLGFKKETADHNYIMRK